MRFLKAVIYPLVVALALSCGFGAANAATAVAKKAPAAPHGPRGSDSYWVVTKTGKVCAAGAAKTYGSGHGTLAGIEGTSDGKGYWLVLTSGGTKAFGDAKRQKYRKAKLTKWSRALGGCKTDVVGAAIADVKTTVRTKPKPPTKTTPTKTTTATTTTPAGPPFTGSMDSGSSSSTDMTTLPTTSTSTPSPSVTTATTTTTPPPVTATTTTTTTPPPPRVPPTITTATVPHAEDGVPYAVSFVATGGAGGYSWSRLSGQLPPGLTLQADGALSGTPSQSGTYVFNLTVSASDGASAEQTYSVTVLSSVSAAAAALAQGEAGIAYSGTSLTAVGGSGPYTWTTAGRDLPDGVQFSSSGTLTGTPEAAGTYDFTATVTDALGGTSAQTFSLTIDAPVSVSTSELPDPVQTLSYDQQLATTGGAGQDTWTISSGALPAGLSLSSSGEITGTATTPGDYNVAVTVTDALGGAATKTYNGPTATWHENAAWSGYAARGVQPYTSVSGTFNVPTLLPGVESNAATSIWVGIDGADNNTLLQAGISAEDTESGDPEYFAWTEMIPQQLMFQEVNGFVVDPGDSITISIDETDPATQTWTLSIADNTTGQSYSTSEVYTGAGETAEWIAEAPTGSDGHTDPMAPWTGAIDFTDPSTSQPTTGLDYMTLSPGFVSGGAMNSLFDSDGFAITDDEQVPPPLPVNGAGA